MLASRYANPEVVAAAFHSRNASKNSNEMKSSENNDRPSSIVDSAEAPEQNATAAAPTPTQSNVAAELSPSTEKPLSPIDPSPEKARVPSPEDTKPLPPLPHVAELQKQQDLPEPPIILASSPGVTTPEYSKTSPEPSSTISNPPPPVVEPKVQEAAPTVENSIPEVIPKAVSPAPSAKARRSKAGKPCAIKLPTDKNKTYSGYPVPLSLSDFKERIDNFERAGYDTRGFGYWKDEEGINTDTRPAQARSEFPDPAEQSQERKQRKFGVSIPDKKRWDDYVNDLMEEKLRSLGVTSGDDEPAPAMSRQVSSPFPALPISPPVPSSSSASQHLWQNTMPFSAPFSPAASTNNTSIGAVASPVSSIGQQVRPSHISRQSNFGYPFPAGSAPYTFQRPWSPQQMSNMQVHPQIVSPATSGGSQRAASGFSVESPDILNERQTTPRGQHSSAQGGSRADQALSWRSNIQPEQARVTSTDNNTDSEPKGDAGPTDFADLASPKPQGHRHNISANLEREAAQYYPGEYVNESREASPSRKTSAENQGLNADDSLSQISAHQPRPSQTSNASGSSRLNIAAKEFKYDPHSTHSRNFSFTNDMFMPGAPKTAKAADATSSVQLATAHSHQGSVSLSNLNVAAPEFKPPAQKNFAFSSSWFNFSAKKPTDPSKPAETPKATPGEEKAPTIGSKIFGNIADIVKPSKKSKAIPIVKPEDASKESDESAVEDEDGRIMQSDLRRKKGRFEGDGGDEVPRFAEPTPEPEPAQQTASKPSVDTELRASPAAPSAQESEVEQDTIRPRPREPALNYDHETTDNLSDGSNVPWHGIESDDRFDDRDETPDVREGDLLTSPTTESGVEEPAWKRDSRGLSPETPATRTRPQGPLNLGDDDSLLYPSFQELDAVMDYINKDNSDFGMEEVKPVGRANDLLTSSPQPPAQHIDTQNDDRQRSLSAPRSELSQQKILVENQAVAGNNEPDWDQELPVLRSVSPRRQAVSPVRKLNKMAEGPVSDWDDMLSSGAELNIPPQNQLNDAHVATLVEGLLRRHLAPFERQLKDLTASIKRPASEFSRLRPISAYEKSESDADDEEDSDHGSRLRSRDAKSDKRMDQIRSAIVEAMATSQSGGYTQVEQEVKFRKAAENRADDLQRLLTLSEREIALFKESTASSEEKIRTLEQEQADLRHRHRIVEEELRTKTLDFTAEVAALENTLDEYRTSSTKWREEIDSVKNTREGLEITIQKLKREASDHQRDREELNGKLAKAEEALSSANSKLTTERSLWDRRDEKQTAELESLHNKLSEAMQSKDRLDQEIARLSEREKEAIRSAVMLEETQNAKQKLETMVNRLNDKTIEHQTIVARYEREASEAHENTAVQVERTKSLMQTDVDIANKRIENIRADLETRLQMTKSELDNVRRDNDAVRSRYERSLNEAVAARKEALQDAADTANTRLQEERKRFEQSLNELSAQHDRAIRNAHEDKQRSETHLNSSLKLAEAKVAHMDDQVRHLEERLSVAQSAAQAAAIAAQSAKQQQQEAAAPSSTSRSAPTASISTPSHLEKISPQALRESIVVLQEQLQEREARIESLESEISTIGRDAPAKLRERETEIGWLRELLGVRIDDLSDLVNSLQMEKFDRGAARNAAIRIKANLQMEQQEKDRVLHGVKPAGPTSALPSLTDIQNFASPKAAQLTSAFNNWRKHGQSPSFAGLREAVNSSTPSKPAPNSKRPEMPSRGFNSTAPKGQDNSSSTALKNPIAAAAAANAGKQNEAQSFLSGLMTPPASNLRRTPSTGAGSAETARPQTPVRPGSSGNADSTGSPGSRLDPTTPPLLRKGDYDLDAELGPDRVAFEGSGDEDDDGDDNEAEGDATEETAERTNLEPFGEVVAAAPVAE